MPVGRGVEVARVEDGGISHADLHHHGADDVARVVRFDREALFHLQQGQLA